jgi:segregation and condensation protein B
MNLVDAVHALLFVADAPASPSSLAEALQIQELEVEQAIQGLRERLAQDGPIHLTQLAGGWQLATKPEYAEAISTFLKPQRQRLSRSLMEVLAIVAYKQPITVGELDAVRGVQSDYSVKVLLERRLIHEVGRRKTPGRPVLYGTTQQFLHQFKLNDLKELPALEISDLTPELATPNPEAVDKHSEQVQ